ncbi:MAG: cysteine hydrolase [Polyangiaceae bacterium]|nr:cysteine hydrolase [Polyangiaceae bacterium]
MNPALLVIDLQNEFFEENSPALASLRSAVEYTNAAIGLFRKAGHPIVVIRDIESPGREPGKSAFLTHESVHVRPEDLHIDKLHGNAFWQTDLEEELRSRSVNFVVLSGFCAEYCVLNTFRGARERGFDAALLRGSLASPHEEHIRFVERTCEVISYGPLEAMLRKHP